MKKNLIATMAICLVLTLSSCSKKLNQFNADYFTTNPTPLEVVGNKIPATITGNIPAKFFVKNAEVTITPVLVYGNEEAASSPITLQGEKVRGNNQVVSYDRGATITIPVMFNYTPEMMKSNLFLAFEVRQGNKVYVLPRVKVGEGVIATSTLATAASVDPSIAADKFQRIINEKYSADIKFLVNQTNVRASELQTASIKALNEKMVETQSAPNLELEGVNISSYASPEGGVALNTRIAEGREKNTQTYLDQTMVKNKINNFGDLTAEFTPQDWEGFQKLVSQSNIQDKELILSVLSMYSDPEIREREIRNLSSVFEQLAIEILPQLRYSRLTASVNVIGKSNEEIMEAFKANPKSLTDDELLYAATLTNDNNLKLKIYNTAIEQYPNDYRGYNNLGVCQYIDGDYTAAANSFAQAAKMAPASPEVKMNQGLIALLQNNMKLANERFGSAAGAPGLSAAIGTYYIEMGEYNQAVRAFGDDKTNNAAVAQILVKDYSAAKSTLAAIPNPDATTYYLMAVLGARTNNEQMVLSNLRQAVRLDSNMAAMAKNDIEFSKFNISSAI